MTVVANYGVGHMYQSMTLPIGRQGNGLDHMYGDGGETGCKIMADAELSWQTKAVPLEELVWPSGRGAINGYWNQYEVMAQFQNPMDGLCALRIGTENCATISFYPEDIISLEIANPNWFFTNHYPSEISLSSIVTHGTKFKIHRHADCLDRFDDGQDAGVGDRMLPLFERIILFPDIVDIEFMPNLTKFNG